MLYNIQYGAPVLPPPLAFLEHHPPQAVEAQQRGNILSNKARQAIQHCSEQIGSTVAGATCSQSPPALSPPPAGK